MDPSLFQFSVTEVLNPPKPFGISSARATTRSARHAGTPSPIEKFNAKSRKLDLTRPFAVTPVVGFHLAKFITWRFKKI
jgi:hypothetical protein